MLLAQTLLPAFFAFSASLSLQQRLQAIATAKAAEYNCSVGIGLQTPSSSLTVAAGVDPSARFVWGSVTKQATGTAILQAVEDGLLKLDEPVYPHLDPMLASLGLGSMRSLFGADAELVTADHLATMASGVPDYDTAKPFPPPPTDPFRAEVYAAPSTEFPPASLINQSWVATGNLTFKPGTNFSYSSTNFVLLGLLVASLRGAPAWDGFKQASIFDRLPPTRRDLYDGVVFAAHGSPAQWDAVRGYDRTSYNGADPTRLPGTDVWRVAGVYGGWTASDLTASVADVARFGYDLHGATGPRLLSRASQQVMVPKPSQFYGFATFNLERAGISGQSTGGPYAAVYGHLGATYGYDSLLAYYPGIDATLAIGTDIETDQQAQPSDTMCLAYNAVLAALTGTPEPSCAYVKSGYYGGRCECGNNYECSKATKQCMTSSRGTLSKADCEAAC